MMVFSILQTSYEEVQEREVRQSAKGECFQFDRQAGKVAKGLTLQSRPPELESQLCHLLAVCP